MIWSRWTGFDKTWVSEAEVADYRRFCPSLEAGGRLVHGPGQPDRRRRARAGAASPR